MLARALPWSWDAQPSAEVEPAVTGSVAEFRRSSLASALPSPEPPSTAAAERPRLRIVACHPLAHLRPGLDDDDGSVDDDIDDSGIDDSHDNGVACHGEDGDENAI